MWRPGATSLAGSIVLLTTCSPEPPTPGFPLAAESLLDGFRQSAAPTPSAYDSLFRYFVLGWHTYRLPDGAGADYPGLPSSHGARADQIEGFARLAPLVAAWVSSGRSSRLALLDDSLEVDLLALLREGVLAGTDPKSPGYWGPIAHFDQRIVETADIALVLWLTRQTLWRGLTETERSQVGRWLAQVNGTRVRDNNWHLFVTFTNAVLNVLGQPADLEEARQHYVRFKSFYRGDGWFSDGPAATFDFYNAWGMHYLLYWLTQVDPAWDPDFLTETFQSFLRKYRYLFGPAGFPIRGRSICYRMAVPAPLVAGQSAHPELIPPDEARRALDDTWRYFIARTGVSRGTVTQGYCGPDARVLDNYSGPASCLWSLRSLVIAFSQAPEAPFWRGKAGQSPVDTADVDVSIPAVRWRIVGRKGSGFVSILNADSLASERTALRSAGLVRRTRELILQRPSRPNNTAAKYYRGWYRGDQPFCGCRLAQPQGGFRSGGLFGQMISATIVRIVHLVVLSPTSTL